MLEGLVGLSWSECSSPSSYLSVLPAKLSGDPGNLILWALIVICQLGDCPSGDGFCTSRCLNRTGVWLLVCDVGAGGGDEGEGDNGQQDRKTMSSTALGSSFPWSPLVPGPAVGWREGTLLFSATFPVLNPPNPL